MPDYNPTAVQIASMLALVQTPPQTKEQLAAAGLETSQASVTSLNRALAADRARDLLRVSDPTHGAVGRQVAAAVPKSAADGVNRTKVASRVVIMGAEQVLDKNTGQPNGRLKLHLRSTPNKDCEDGREHVFTPFSNTGEGQVLIAKAKRAKGKLVTCYIEMQPMGNGQSARVLADVVYIKELSADDAAKLGITNEDFAAANLTPPTA